MTLFMGVLTPALGAGSAVPDVLLLNVLPWAEDLRLHAFTTFRYCPGCQAVLSLRSAPNRRTAPAATEAAGRPPASFLCHRALCR